MILTPISAAKLPQRAAQFAAHLRDPVAYKAFARIAATSPNRAAGARAEWHRLAARRLAKAIGIDIREGLPSRSLGWNGSIMRAGTEAYVLLHEIAHYQLAGPIRRRRREFALGPGPETGHRTAAERATLLRGMAREREEAMASLLGILWEMELGQPALASFLDQNWLEGSDRPSSAVHFETVLARLMRVGLVLPTGRPVLSARLCPRYPDRTFS